MIKYKIGSYKHYDHHLNKETNLYDLIEKDIYYIVRKGRIFGFWYRVGDWLCDSQGNSFCADEKFDSYEQAESYLKCWHKETYGNKEYNLIST